MKRTLLILLLLASMKISALSQSFSFKRLEQKIIELADSLQAKGPQDFQNLSLSFSHVTTFFKSFTVIYFTLNNVLNTKNVLNFRYSIDGFRTIEVPPPAFRSFFAGINMRF